MPYSSSDVATATRRPSCYASTYSAYRSTSYVGSSSYLSSRSGGSAAARSSSLDRSSRSELAAYRPSSHHVSSTTYRSTASPRSTTAYLSATSRIADIDLKSRLAKFDFGSTLRSATSTATKSSCDAIHDHFSSPVLTNYRRFGEGGGAYRRSALDLKLPPSSSISSSAAVAADSAYASRANLLDSDSGISASSSSSSSGSSSPSLSTGSARSHSKLSLDENSNRTYARCKYDANHNVCGARDEEDEAKGAGEAPRRSRFGSTDDVGYVGRHRRTSGQASTSGYSSDASSTSSSGSPASSSFKSESGSVVGLRNLGNTCFMNSVLQCLINTRPLLEYCLRESYVSDINSSISSMKGALIKAFASLLQTMCKAKSNDPAINPQAFKSQIQKFAPRFMGYSQQDAQEFLRYLLQGLHEDVNRVTSKPMALHSDIDDNLSDSQKASESWRRYLRFDDSKIVDLFVGQLKSTLRCTVCGHTSVTFDPFWDLSLPLPKSVGSIRLQQCFDLFTREEILDGDEKPTCARCKTRRKCSKTFTIQKFPKILVIHLKRFSPSEKYKSKLTMSVDFSLNNLDLSSYAANGSRGQNCTYNLYGVSNHSGTVYTGHYTAYCKHPYSGDWHDFNDSRVSKVPTSSVTSSEAYVLFYEQSASHSSRL